MTLDLGDVRQRPLFYILDEQGKPEPITDMSSPRLAEWHAISWQEGPRSRRIALDHVGPWRISTVFLMVDHQFDDGPPELWETMVFGPEPWDDFQERYTSREAAEAGHRDVVGQVRQSA